MVSFTTVGYGDLYPTTPAFRVAAGLMMFMGLIALAEVRLLREELADLPDGIAPGEPRLARHDDGPSSS